MKAQIVRWGNSLAVRIPKPTAKEAQFKEGDYLELDASQGQIQLRRIRKGRVPRLEKLVSQITPENRYSEISSGPDVGREKIDW